MAADVNLSSAERGDRLRFAMVTLTLAIGLLIALSEFAASPMWWAVVLVPLFLASLQIVQAYTGICIYRARCGTRMCAEGLEPILDPRSRSAVESRARIVLGTSAGMATSATVLVVAVAYLR